MSKGKFIVIEGCDGCGKSYLIKKLKEEYKDNKNIIFIKEPGSTTFSKNVAKLIKDNPELDEEIKMHLFSAERLDLLQKVILPALEEGKTVISERFALSMWAYQCSKNNSLITMMKLILRNLSERVKVDNTIYFRATAEDILPNDTPIKEKTELGHLLLWYSVALQGQEYPKELIGDILNIESNSIRLKNYIQTVKTKIDEIISSNSRLASGNQTI